MTHLSDYSYLDRLVPSLVILIVAIVHCFVRHNALQDLRPSKLREGKLKGYVLFCYVSAVVLTICYDVMATIIKYREGFLDSCVDSCSAWEHGRRNCTHISTCRGIIQKPYELYGEDSVRLLLPTETLWNLSCTLRSSGLFLLLASFNGALKYLFPVPVMKQAEVRFFTGYSLLSLALYFLLQAAFDYDKLLSTIMPQLLYSVECTVGGMYVLLTNSRINRLLKNMDCSSQSSSAGPLLYVKTMNVFLAAALFLDALGLGCINVDILMWKYGNGSGRLYFSKLKTDIFTRIFNLGYILTPVFSLLIIYRPAFVQPSSPVVEEASDSLNPRLSSSVYTNKAVVHQEFSLTDKGSRNPAAPSSASERQINVI